MKYNIFIHIHDSYNICINTSYISKAHNIHIENTFTLLKHSTSYTNVLYTYGILSHANIFRYVFKHSDDYDLLYKHSHDLDYGVVPVICANVGYNATRTANSNISNGILEQNDSTLLLSDSCLYSSAILAISLFSSPFFTE